MIIRSNRQVPAPTPELQCLPDTTERMLDSVRQLIQDRAVLPTRVFMSRLERLIDELVSNLVPLLAAEERVLCHRLDRALGDPLREDHREIRRLVERLSMLSEGLERRSRRSTKAEQVVLTALQQMTIALDALRTYQQAALSHFSDTLSLDEQARLAATLETASLDAREQTMLIVRPSIPALASNVLRKRPDLNAAYALSLTEIERRVHRGGAASE